MPVIELALACLAKELDAHLHARSGTAPGFVTLTRLVGDDGRWAIAGDGVGIMLVNVHLDRASKAAPASGPLELGEPSAPGSRLNLNLSMLVAARSRDYAAGLGHLSRVLGFFHAHPVFSRAQYPALGEAVEMVEVTLEPLDYEQLDHVWAFVGGKQVPSAVYRVRLIAT
jgi:Pvc16 N-terminal domain